MSLSNSWTDDAAGRSSCAVSREKEAVWPAVHDVSAMRATDSDFWLNNGWGWTWAGDKARAETRDKSMHRTKEVLKRGSEIGVGMVVTGVGTAVGIAFEIGIAIESRIGKR
eukprot:6178586-Pleurochrysis_carterae.AAC.1